MQHAKKKERMDGQVKGRAISAVVASPWLPSPIRPSLITGVARRSNATLQNLFLTDPRDHGPHPSHTTTTTTTTTTVFLSPLSLVLCFLLLHSLAFCCCWLVPFLRVETPRTQLVHHHPSPSGERHTRTQRGKSPGGRTPAAVGAPQGGAPHASLPRSKNREIRPSPLLTLAVAGESFFLDATGARSGVLGFPETGAVISTASCGVVADTCVSMARMRFLSAQEEAVEEQEEFFDSRETMSPASVSSPASSGRHDNGWLFGETLLDVWVKDPSSVHERRQRFFKSLGLLDPCNYGARPDEEPCSRPDATEENLLACPSAEFFSAVPSSAGRGGEPIASGDGGAGTEEELECVFKNLDDGTVFVVDEMGKDGSFRSLRERRSNRTVTAAEFEQTFGSSPFIRQMMRRVEDLDEPSTPGKAVTTRRRRRRLGWLRRLGIGACVVDAEEDDEMKSTSSSSCRSCSGKVNRVKVRPYKKRSKELSAVYKGQVIKAHEGAIVTMKFSSDGQYLATGGEDGVVRVWRVMEGEKPDEHDFVEDDPSCVFFTVNENSELAPINSCDGDKGKHNKSSKGGADPACVVIPHRTFALSEDPVHEFHGHDDVILDLSWSKNRELLSASMDKTARLWKVGCNSCLKVFTHNNYVTCVQFKPTNDNYFISGCIDGIVRIWDISRCQVVDWADSKEIVTAVCYRPDGKGAVAGTITGNCHYYDASENQLELESQVPLYGRKKSPLKRIIGFQYCPSDPKKLMVTSGDSQIRILDGAHVVSNYKGLRSSNQVAASFTPDGDHIVSASDDSSIYMWNYANQIAPVTSCVKTVWSYERFFCNDVSVAIPWNASPAKSSISLACNIPSSRQEASNDLCNLQDTASNCHAEDSHDGDNLYQLPSGNFTLSNAFFAESAPRGSATWPEEQLPSNSVTQSSTLRKSQYKFLKASCQSAATHAWGQVIVAAGWDGHIRSFQNYGLPVQV